MNLGGRIVWSQCAQAFVRALSYTGPSASLVTFIAPTNTSNPTTTFLRLMRPKAGFEKTISESRHFHSRSADNQAGDREHVDYGAFQADVTVRACASQAVSASYLLFLAFKERSCTLLIVLGTGKQTCASRVGARHRL